MKHADALPNCNQFSCEGTCLSLKPNISQLLSFYILNTSYQIKACNLQVTSLLVFIATIPRRVDAMLLSHVPQQVVSPCNTPSGIFAILYRTEIGAGLLKALLMTAADMAFEILCTIEALGIASCVRAEEVSIVNFQMPAVH